MIRLRRLYSTPAVFEPIEFHDGVNLILGEKVDESVALDRKDRKTNGVGKSLSVEFLNFCLLEKPDDSRVMKIPPDKFSEETEINLDLVINEHNVTISRTKKEPTKPSISIDGEMQLFTSLADALSTLTNLIQADGSSLDGLSFRELMAPLIREEGSEFKDILHCYDARIKIPVTELIQTHLYFFGIDFGIVQDANKLISKIESESDYMGAIKRKLTEDGKKMREVKAEVNALAYEIDKMSVALDDFKTNPVYQEHQIELSKIEEELERLRTEQFAIRYRLKQIEELPKLENIDKEEIEIVYNQFRDGLGDVVAKSLEQVIAFKKKIDAFQRHVIAEGAAEMKGELRLKGANIEKLEDRRGDILRLLSQEGVLRDFKSGLAIYHKQVEDLNRIQGQLSDYESTERTLKSLRAKKDNLLGELDADIFKTGGTIRSFTSDLIEAHNFIMGTPKVSFEIHTKDSKQSKQIVEIIFRIDDDGSHSVDRTKVFIYDTTLMLNEYTRRRHPGVLVHDNIFDVDQDTLVQSLNYLDKREKSGKDFQYILTLNRDKIESEERRKEISLNVEEHMVARFTRKSKFLKVDYQEIN